MRLQLCARSCAATAVCPPTPVSNAQALGVTPGNAEATAPTGKRSTSSHLAGEAVQAPSCRAGVIGVRETAPSSVPSPQPVPCARGARRAQESTSDPREATCSPDSAHAGSMLQETAPCTCRGQCKRSSLELRCTCLPSISTFLRDPKHAAAPNMAARAERRATQPSSFCQSKLVCEKSARQ